MYIVLHGNGNCLGHQQESNWIGQPAHTENLLQRLDMQDCKPSNTTVKVSANLSATEQDQSAVASQIYLSASTQPDIAYGVSSISRFNAILINNIGQN